MRSLLIALLALAMAGTAFAQLDDSIGMFFSETEFTPENTNFDPTIAVPFDAWVALLNTTVVSVGGYEAGFMVDPNLIVLTVDGPNGWTNFGSPLNHLVGYTTPIPADGADVVLCHFQFLYLVASPSEFYMGPSEPSSVGGEGPAIADGDNPDILVVCNYTSGPDLGGLVATLYGPGIDFPVGTESQTLSDVRALFE